MDARIAARLTLRALLAARGSACTPMGLRTGGGRGNARVATRLALRAYLAAACVNFINEREGQEKRKQNGRDTRAEHVGWE